MDKDKLKEILDKHLKWWRNEDGCQRADLRHADLRHADLRHADLRGADLRGADLQGADLQGAYLRHADLRHADLRHADLRHAYLRHADLRHADLRGAYLRHADLRHADLRDAKGMYWMKKLLLDKPIVLKYLGFEMHKNHFIGYKSFGEHHNKPKKWGDIKKNITIKERVDPDIHVTCSRGINIGTKEWCADNCSKKIWKVEIPFTADIIVPLHTDGKIRVSECKLIDII